jgi:pilus assembly protein CpaB
MNVRRILLLLAAVGAAVSSAQVVRSWLEGRERQLAAAATAVPEEKRKAVLVAARPIAAGSFVTQQSLSWQDWPDVEVPESYIVRGEAEAAEFEGAVARRDLLVGEPVTSESLVRPGERGFLAAVLEPGMRAVSVPIDEATGNAGLVFPGDRVDLVLAQRLERGAESGSASEVVVQNARVLAVGQRLSAASADADPPTTKERTVTLEVTPEGAKRVALAQELGRLVLSLRSLARDSTEPSSEAVAITDPPLWDTQLSRARGARRGVLVLRGGEAATVTVVDAPVAAETAP